MKRMLATGSIVVLGFFAGSATASAAPADAACFGQVHKAVNSGALADLGINNVGQLVQALGGQGKNAAAHGLCGG